MKKLLVNLMLVMVMVVSFVGCNSTKGVNNTGDNEKIKLICTAFPQYDWVREIIGDESNVELTLLVENGTDIHNYQPSAMDIALISNCDIFIYIGGESDAWAEDILAEAMNKDMIAINMLEALGDSVKEEELIEGMEKEAHEEHGDHEDHEEAEYDEHVWLSVKNAKVLCNVISKSLVEADMSNKEKYESNCEEYIGKLEDIDEKYQSVVDSAKRNTILFGDRFPFRYMVEDYDIDYYAAFVGCSAETEASFETIAFLSQKVDELELPYVIVIDNGEKQLANTIIANTKNKDQEVLVMNSMQAVTKDEISKGVTYISVMVDNINVLEKALN